MREDQEYNVRFVKCVQRHRNIYDFSLMDYTNKEKQEKSWREIATEMDSSVGDCKERWRNLRGSLTRHLKLLARKDRKPGKPKPYYLMEHMQFIVPYTKTRSRAVLPFIEDNLDPESAIFKYQKHEYDEEDDDVDEGLELAPPPAVVVAGRRSCSPDGESSESVLKLKRPREDLDSDPDLNFFTSLLPDVRSMNPAQKRQLKMGVLKLIDEILTFNGFSESTNAGNTEASQSLLSLN